MATRVQYLETSIWAMGGLDKVRPHLSDEDRAQAIELLKGDLGKEQVVHVPAKRGRKPKNHSEE